MKVRLLGSGIATGVPTWNDGSEVARKARTLDADPVSYTHLTLPTKA